MNENKIISTMGVFMLVVIGMVLQTFLELITNTVNFETMLANSLIPKEFTLLLIAVVIGSSIFMIIFLASKMKFELEKGSRPLSNVRGKT